MQQRQEKAQEEPNAFDLQHIGKQQDLLMHSKIQSQTASKMLLKQPIQPQQIRIPEEQIIIKEPGQKALVNSILCPICLVTLPMPYYECQQCNNSFCLNCMENWWGKNSNSSEQKTCIFKCENPTFKKVKRSNTYLALFEALQFKCGLCALVSSLSSYKKHKLKECPETEMKCQNFNCDSVVKRKDLGEHEKSCEYRLEACRYCGLKMIWKQLQNHEESLCDEKTVKCQFKQCQKLIREVTCPWCCQQFLQTQFNNHSLNCQKRTVDCEWCNKPFKIQEFYVHKCPLAKQDCKLCENSFLFTEMTEHKSQCMFENMVKMKKQNQMLLQENAKLHMKVNELQELIEDTISNSEGKALEVMKKFKLNERKELQKDLMRIDYSMGSVNRLKEEQITQHMNKTKYMILGHSLCIQCKILDKKFTDMLQPLMRKRKEITDRIQEFDKFNETARG